MDLTPVFASLKRPRHDDTRDADTDLAAELPWQEPAAPTTATPPTNNQKYRLCSVCHKKRSSFGPEGGTLTWCKGCSPPDSVDLAHVNKKCIVCHKKRSSFGPEGGTLTWCKGCSPPDSVDLAHVNKNCIVCHKKRSSYGPEGGTLTWCKGCSPPDSVDIHNKKCVTENCDTRATNSALNGYCMGCFSYEFPTHKLVRYARSEEMAVLDAVYTRFADEDWADKMVHDRRIRGGCSQKRPDIFLDLGTHILIVEVDEHQHKKGDYSSCDNMRTMTLFQDSGSLPVVFLRFNPHNYVSANGVAVPSPWTKTKTEQRPRVTDKHKREWSARLLRLFGRIQYWTQLEGFPAKEVTVEYLFYDS